MPTSHRPSLPAAVAAHRPRTLVAAVAGWLLVWACLAGGAAHAEEVARLLSPAPGTQGLGADVTFSWSAVANAQAYYLYVGSSPGAKDLVNTGEIAATSRLLRNLPPATTLYVRTWVKYDGHWHYSDAQLATAGAAQLVTPAPGASGLPTTVDFSWIRIHGAQAYALELGLSPGTRDVLASGPLQGTAFRAVLPEGETLHARLWTLRDGAWLCSDAVIATRALTARLLAPADGAGEVHPRPTFSWTAVPDAVRYYVYVGTSVGAKDVVNSGEITATSLRSRPLEGARRYYLRLHARVDNAWRHRDYTFTTRNYATLIAPEPGSRTADPELTLRWTPVVGAEKYYVYVGRRPGDRDLYNSGELQAASATAYGLPGGEAMYVRLWTRHGGAWRFEDQQFTTRAVPRFVQPRPGTTGFDRSQPLRWTTVQGADAWWLDIGTEPGGGNLLSTSVTGRQEYPATDLPVANTVYARIRARVNGAWVAGDTLFATATSQPAAALRSPVPGGRIAGPALFEWSAVPVAAGYRLLLGTAPGASDLHDSGIVSVTRRRVEQLPQGMPVYGTLQTHFASGRYAGRSFVVTAGDMTLDTPTRLDLALHAAADVRRMATSANLAHPHTPLAALVRGRDANTALCSDYAFALLQVLQEMNLGVEARAAGVCLVPASGYDCHSLVEILDPATGEWLLTDPTFGLIPRRALDARPLTSQAFSEIVRAQDWQALAFEYLTPQQDQYARDYYLDYPLLFVHVLAPDQHTLVSSLVPISGYFDAFGGTTASGASTYSVRCLLQQSQVAVSIDGVARSLPCDTRLGYTPAFVASSVGLPGDTIRSAFVTRPLRPVFPPRQ